MKTRKDYRNQFLSTRPLYCTWTNMKARCSNPLATHYDKYGGRGIRVCDEWINDYHRFVSDMGDRPDGYTLDRIDNNGNYTKENCRWASRSLNQLNRRIFSRNTSGKTGVTFHNTSRTWHAQLMVNKKIVGFKSFHQLADAVAYREQLENLFLTDSLV